MGPLFVWCAVEQGALERELSHYSSLTAGCTVPIRIKGSLYLLKVNALLDGKAMQVSLSVSFVSSVSSVSFGVFLPFLLHLWCLCCCCWQ